MAEDREQFLLLCLAVAVRKCGGSVEVLEDEDEKVEDGMVTWRPNKEGNGYIVNFFDKKQVGHA